MPSATARDFQRVAWLLGFSLTRTKGSHERWNHADGRSVTIPVHGGKEIGPHLFFKILRHWDSRLINLRSFADRPVKRDLVRSLKANS